MTTAAQEPRPNGKARALPPPGLRTRREVKAARKAMELRAVAKAAKVKARDRGRVVPDLSLWDQAGRLGGKLTPADVSQIIRAADAGDLVRLMDLANECRQKDCHLSAVLTVAEESIAGLQWKLVLPDGARAKDKRAMKWVDARLRALPQLRKLVAYLAGARYYGFDVSEILWSRVDGGRLAPVDFAHLSHRRFGFDPETGAFVLRDQGDPQQGTDFRRKWPNKFVVSQPRANGDAPQREGLCRPLIWMTQFRVWTFSDWLRTAELAWKPWRIGTYKKNASDTEDRDGLEHILQKLSTTGWAAKPDSMDIDIEWPDGTQTAKATHSELVNVLAMEMSKCVLGQTETVQASASSGYAQAKVHDSVRRDIREAAAMQVAADITRDIVRPMIELNFTGVAVPQFEFLTQDPVDLKAFSEAVEKLVKSTLRVPTKWVYDNAGIPVPKEGEEVIGGAPAKPEDEDPKDPDDDKEPDDGDDEEEKPPTPDDEGEAEPDPGEED
jgi:phage gp29-like protein